MNKKGGSAMESNEHMIDEILRHLDSELEHGR